MSVQDTTVTARRAFGIVNANVLRSPQISTSAKALYALLATYADETGTCWPSNETLRKGLGCSERTIQNLLAELVEKRVIIRQDRYVDGRQVNSLTTLVDIETAGRGEPYFTPGGATDDTPGGATGFLQNKTSKNKTRGTNTSSPGSDARPHRPSDDPAFMAFYDLYPRHEARADAYKAWRQVTCNAKPPRDPSCIMAGLRTQVRHLTDQKAEGYCPLPASWLRAERWDDEITPRRVLTPRSPDPPPYQTTYTEHLARVHQEMERHR